MRAKVTKAAPTGRKKPAQGKEPSAAALSSQAQNVSRPEGAKEGSGSDSALGFDSLGNALPSSAITENELPKGWRWVRVREIGDVQLGRQRAPKHQNGAHMRPYLRVANVFEDRIDLSDVLTMNFTPQEFETFALRTNDILLNEGQSLHLVGRAALYRDELPGGCFQNTLVRFRSGSAVDPKFALTIFRGYMHTGKFQKIARWTTSIAHLGAQRFAEMPFPLPPLHEQRRIVAEIEKQFTRLEAGVAALRRVQANLKRYRAAVLKAACEGRLVPTEAELHRSGRASTPDFESGAEFLKRILAERRQNWHGRGQYKEPAAPQPLAEVELPEGWTWATMPQLGELNRGKSRHRPRDDARLYDGPYPFIQTGDIRKSGGTIQEHTQTYSEFGLQQSRLWPEGTLCITIAANIAETGILKFESCFPDSVVGFIHSGNPVTTRYVEFFLRTAKEKLAQFAPATAQKNINLDVLQKVAIPVPPFAEQKRIVAEVELRLSVVEELESVVSANLQRATRLRQSILQKAFTGELIS